MAFREPLWTTKVPKIQWKIRRLFLYNHTVFFIQWRVGFLGSKAVKGSHALWNGSTWQVWRATHSPQSAFTKRFTAYYKASYTTDNATLRDNDNFLLSALWRNYCFNIFWSCEAKDISNIYIHSFIHSFIHGTEPFLRSCQLCSYSRTSQHFMEPEGSLPRSQEPSTSPYPELDQSNPYHPTLSL
jgi:hypothetical protein